MINIERRNGYPVDPAAVGFISAVLPAGRERNP
ncbi:hypothetical protein EDC52_103310 [Biostraticola tofi]|uniref:Uncharacterized protein n=1 Tax=Biostraticola tofi TaxID=466109 RepID=A0A4V2W537_9GAMM|nr:hypothetical protein EDC52_103310 [Biostraticola tofi]